MASSTLQHIKQSFISLQSPNFRLFFTGQIISFIGTWIQNIGMGWLVYSISGSIGLLGVVGFCSQIPFFIVTPLAGVFADKLNKKKVMITTQSLLMVVALTFAVLTLTHTITTWMIIGLSVVNGMVVAFDTPFRLSILSDLLEKKEHLSNAVALNSIMINSSRFIGPAIAGVLIAKFGEGICFLANSFSFLAVIIALLLIKLNYANLPKFDINPKSVKEELFAGIRYTKGSLGFRHILVLVVFSSLLCMPIQNFLPAFAKDIFHGDSQTLGLFSGTFGLGALIGAFLIGQVSKPLNLIKLIGIAGIMLSGGIILFSSSHIMPLAMFALAIAGTGMIIQFASSNTILQVYSDPQYRGRLVSLYNVSFFGVTPIGNLMLGFFAEYLSIQVTMIISSLIFMSMAISFFIKHKFVRKQIQQTLNEQ